MRLPTGQRKLGILDQVAYGGFQTLGLYISFSIINRVQMMRTTRKQKALIISNICIVTVALWYTLYTHPVVKSKNRMGNNRWI